MILHTAVNGEFAPNSDIATVRRLAPTTLAGVPSSLFTVLVMTCLVRSYTEADKPDILALSLRAWKPVFEKLERAVPDHVYNAFYPRGWWTRQSADIERLLVNEGVLVLVAVSGETILGWVGVRLHPTDSMGEIYILAVDPAHQRTGVGSALMDVAIERMREAGMSIAMVETGDDPGHAPSRAAYESIGFERWPVARYFRKI